MTDDMTAKIAALLEKSGLSPADAQARARASIAGLEACAPGSGWGHIDPDELGNIWRRAARAGRRRLVLEIVSEAGELEDDTGRVIVTVQEADTWPEWTDEHTAQRRATDALLSTPRRIDAPPLDVLTRPLPRGWDEIDTDTDDTEPAPARARAQELN